VFGAGLAIFLFPEASWQYYLPIHQVVPLEEEILQFMPILQNISLVDPDADDLIDFLALELQQIRVASAFKYGIPVYVQFFEDAYRATWLEHRKDATSRHGYAIVVHDTHRADEPQYEVPLRYVTLRFTTADLVQFAPGTQYASKFAFVVLHPWLTNVDCLITESIDRAAVSSSA
jgi:hypothetical protein